MILLVYYMYKDVWIGVYQHEIKRENKMVDIRFRDHYV